MKLIKAEREREREVNKLERKPENKAVEGLLSSYIPARLFLHLEAKVCFLDACCYDLMIGLCLSWWLFDNS